MNNIVVSTIIHIFAFNIIKYYNVQKRQNIHSGYDSWKFIKYKPDSHIKKIYSKMF